MKKKPFVGTNVYFVQTNTFSVWANTYFSGPYTPPYICGFFFINKKSKNVVGFPYDKRMLFTKLVNFLSFALSACFFFFCFWFFFRKHVYYRRKLWYIITHGSDPLLYETISKYTYLKCQQFWKEIFNDYLIIDKWL